MRSERRRGWCRRTAAAFVAGAMAAVLCTATSSAQETDASDNDMAVIHCQDRVELQTIVDYCGEALDVRFLYGEELTDKTVRLRPSPIELPKKHLLNLLISLLRVRDLALVEESAGLYRIVQAEQAGRSAATVLADDATVDRDSNRLVTQVLRTAGGKVEGISEHLAKYTSSPKGGVIPVPSRGLIIVTDYESRIAVLRELLALLDTAAPDVQVRSIDVPDADPATIASQISAVLTETHRVRQAPGLPAAVRGDILPGSVVVIGTSDQIEAAGSLIRSFTPDGVEVESRAYALKHISVDRAAKLIDKVLLAPGSGLRPPRALYQDEPGGRLFVTADRTTHTAIAHLLEMEDHPSTRTQRPLRIYRPRHRKAGDLLAALTQLLDEGARIGAVEKVGDEVRDGTPSRAFTQVPPEPPPLETAASQPPIRVAGNDYVLTVDEATNAILAVGSRGFHTQLAMLIEDLDRRRPQVLIEITLVAITVSDSLEVGVEIEALDLGDAWDYVLFTNFGLSSLDVTTGQRILEPGVGGNGVLIGPDEIPIIIRALATHADARVVSTARLLVSDNARGTLRNVDEAPFTAVNASDTVATTSFGGFESAGTTLSVTPHIAEGDHLTLEYELTFSNFSGSSSTATIPPPRTTNSFTSVVEVPDGCAVITGGLVVDNDTNSVSEVPLLGRIPVFGKLFQSTSTKKTKTKIFALIRPVILRDDRFADLKFATLRYVEPADLAGDSPPPSKPLWMR